MAITVIHYRGGYKHAVNSVGRVVLGSGYFTGRQKPNFPVPTLQNHLNFIAAEPMEPHIDFKAIGWYGLHTSQY